MAGVVAKRKHEASSGASKDDSAAAKQTGSGVKSAKPDAPKKRRTASQAPPPVQKNTLDRWFGVAKKAPATPSKPSEDVATKSDSDVEVAKTPVVHATTKKAAFKSKDKGKGLVQRRILLGDQCRVCESAKTESSARCERKCMECEMTVHMSCYGVDEDDEVLPEKWRCRPCQATFNLTEERPEADGNDDDDDEDSVVRGIPVHEPRGENGRFNGLYQCSDFAAVFLFLKRFRRLGLKLGVDVTVNTLASALLAPRDHTMLYELHTRLLQNVSATISKNGNWVDNLIRFLKASDYGIGGELVRRLAACGNANDWLETYYDVAVTDRVALLKVLCEAQFDENDTLVEKLGHTDTSPESLREETLGVDAAKRAYYLLEDPANFSDGSAWLCRCHPLDGATWETVTDDLASLESFVLALSYSTETADLQLWQTLANGVAKTLARREKKKLQQSQRLARVPRMLRSTGLDMTSILPESGSRSLRTRRAVNYRSYASEDEEEEDSEAEDQDDEEEEDDEEDDDGRDDDALRRSSRRRPSRVEARPTRSSRRLRGSPRRQGEESDVSDDDNKDDDDDDDNDEEDEEEEERDAGDEQAADDDSDDSA